MIEARGGIVALQNNWRLELVVYLWVIFLSLISAVSDSSDIFKRFFDVSTILA